MTAIELFEHYKKSINKLTGLNQDHTFIFNLDAFENCLIILFEELKIKDITKITKKFIDFHRFTFISLFKKINLKFNIENLTLLIDVVLTLSALIDNQSKELKLCQNASGIGFEPLSEKQSSVIVKEGYTKAKQQSESRSKGIKFEHYYYQFFGMDFDVMPRLFFIDSVRKNLTEKGDSLYNKRDAVYSIVKYFNYMGGIKLEQTT